MSTEQENIALWYRNAIPFARFMGIDLVGYADGRSELHYTPEPEHLNALGVVHGGASMALLDVTLAAAARSLDPHSALVTIEMKTSFMQAPSGKLIGRGRLLHRSRSMAFVEGTIEDAEGRVCTHATGTFKYVPRPEGRVAG